MKESTRMHHRTSGLNALTLRGKWRNRNEKEDEEEKEDDEEETRRKKNWKNECNEPPN